MGALPELGLGGTHGIQHAQGRQGLSWRLLAFRFSVYGGLSKTISPQSQKPRLQIMASITRCGDAAGVTELSSY
jgi:hypothetical protein